MIGDRVNTKPKHSRAAKQIMELLEGRFGEGRIAFTVAGQSGAGKSEIAQEIATLLDASGRRTVILQQDDYFFFPPRTNHNRRVDDIDWVGINEVNLQLLDDHLAKFKSEGGTVFEKPLVVFDEDRIIAEKVDLSPFQAIIAEGTYTTLLKSADYHVFIDRDYHDTKKDREERGREKIDDFSEQIMKIEDAIISKHKALADVIVNKDFTVSVAKK